MLDPALASSKTYKSEFYISGLPKYAHQGCHIFGGCKDIISNLAPDNGEFINKGSHSIRIFRDFYLIISLSDRGVSLSTLQAVLERASAHGIETEGIYNIADCVKKLHLSHERIVSVIS